MTRSRAGNKILAWIEKTFLVAGVIGVGLWLGSNMVPAIWQSWDNWVFDRQVRGEEATVTGYLTEKQRQITDAVRARLGIAATPERSPAPQNQPARPPLLENNALIGRLTIPRLNLNTTVREGTREDTLVLAAGHIRGTALPGWNGNVAVAGHRDTLFRGLAGIRKNDLIQFETPRGRYDYQVASIEIVTPQDVRVLRASSYSELTLVTCYPFDYIGSAPDRFVVKARQVSASPLQGSFGEASQEAPPRKLEPARGAQGLAGPNRDLPAGTAIFHISKRHSQQLAPGISLGVDETDGARGRVDGWMWIMPDRRTIWLRDHAAQQPLIFHQNGERRVLLITNVTDSSVTGHLLGRGQAAGALSVLPYGRRSVQPRRAEWYAPRTSQ